MKPASLDIAMETEELRLSRQEDVLNVGVIGWVDTKTDSQTHQGHRTRFEDTYSLPAGHCVFQLSPSVLLCVFLFASVP